MEEKDEILYFSLTEKTEDELGNNGGWPEEMNVGNYSSLDKAAQALLEYVKVKYDGVPSNNVVSFEITPFFKSYLDKKFIVL